MFAIYRRQIARAESQLATKTKNSRVVVVYTKRFENRVNVEPSIIRLPQPGYLSLEVIGYAPNLIELTRVN
jgi:hypothetical protein